jgi:hypothetical protein
MLLMVACGTSISTNYDYDVNARFEQYRTYDWVPKKESNAGGAGAARQQSDLMNNRIKNAIAQQLSEKGFTENSSGPDVLMIFHTGVQDKVQVTDWGYRYSDYYWGWGGRDIDVYNYEEGTLIIDMVDAKTNQLVWRGAGSVALDNNMSPEKANNLVNSVVGKIFSKYPPKR